MYKDKDAPAEMQNVLQKAMAIYPATPEFPLYMGELKIIEGKNQDGENYINQSCNLDPMCDDAMLYREIGNAYMKNDDIKNALLNFQKCVDAAIAYKKAKSADAFGNVEQFIDAVAIFNYNNGGGFDVSQKMYQDAGQVYPEYQNVYANRLQLMANDYDSKKSAGKK